MQINQFDISERNRIQQLNFQSSSYSYANVVPNIRQKDNIGLGLANLVIKGIGVYGEHKERERIQQEKLDKEQEAERKRNSALAYMDGVTQFRTSKAEYLSNNPETTSKEYKNFLNGFMDDKRELTDLFNEEDSYRWADLYLKEDETINNLLFKENSEINLDMSKMIVNSAGSMSELKSKMDELMLGNGAVPKTKDLLNDYVSSAETMLQYYASDDRLPIKQIYEQFPLLSKPTKDNDVIQDTDIRAGFDYKVAKIIKAREDKRKAEAERLARVNAERVSENKRMQLENGFVDIQIQLSEGKITDQEATVLQQELGKKFGKSILEVLTLSNKTAKAIQEESERIGDLNTAISIANSNGNTVSSLEDGASNIMNMYNQGDLEGAFKAFMVTAKASEDYVFKNEKSNKNINDIVNMGYHLNVSPLEENGFKYIMEKLNDENHNEKLDKEIKKSLTQNEQDNFDVLMTNLRIDFDLQQEIKREYIRRIDRGERTNINRVIDEFTKGGNPNIFKPTHKPYEKVKNFTNTPIDATNYDYFTRPLEKMDKRTLEIIGLDKMGEVGNISVLDVVPQRNGGVVVNYKPASSKLEIATSFIFGSKSFDVIMRDLPFSDKTKEQKNIDIPESNLDLSNVNSMVLSKEQVEKIIEKGRLDSKSKTILTKDDVDKFVSKSKQFNGNKEKILSSVLQENREIMNSIKDIQKIEKDNNISGILNLTSERILEEANEELSKSEYYIYGSDAERIKLMEDWTANKLKEYIIDLNKEIKGK